MRKDDNLPPSCAVVTKSGNRNFLEPSGPVQACNGTALPYIHGLREYVIQWNSVIKTSVLYYTSRIESEIFLSTN